MNIALLGTFALCAAVLVAVIGLLTSLAAVRFESAPLLRAARLSAFALAGLFAAASAALVWLLLSNDFSIDYIARHSERALATGYKLAVFWAGQEGSLLLWALMVAVMGAVLVIVQSRQAKAIPLHDRPATQPTPSSGHTPGKAVLPYASIGTVSGVKPLTEPAVAIAVLSLVGGFFAALMLFAASPFAPAEHVMGDGHGLNPMLQNPEMVAHPPMLFLGYAASTIPFALMVGALVARRKDSAWIASIRRWTLATWLFLTIGILLGAQWAYVELGWGGYWAWDPVENASLLPWLTATALLHSVAGQHQRGMFRVWNVVLVSLTFLLCVFGTYLTRSGVVQSVHGFGESAVGTFFLAFLTIVTLATALLVIVRWADLNHGPRLESLVTREGAFAIGNWLFVVMLALTLVGTIFPLISSWIMPQSVSVSGDYYNRAVLPVAMLAIGVMAFGPLLTHHKPTLDKLAPRLVFPLTGAVAAIAALIAMGILHPWALAGAAVAAIAVACFFEDLVRTAIERSRSHGEMFPLALIKVLDANHRRYGGQVAHLGIVMLMLGIVGSSLYGVKENLSLKPGESATFAGNIIRLEKLQETREANYVAVEAVVTLTDARGTVSNILPQKRLYDKAPDQWNSEVAIQTDLKRDLYVSLAGWEENGRMVTIQAISNPLVVWIWIGGIAMSLGGLVCLMPRLSLRPAATARPVELPVAVAGQLKVSTR